MQSSYSHGIYYKGNSRSWWISSPEEFFADTVMAVDETDGCIWGQKTNSFTNAVRPVVCIPTVVFDIKYAPTMVEPTE